MDVKLLRILYIAEFLLALIAVFTVWSQVGGQAHLDQMAWYLKLPLGVLMAYSIVRATGAAVSEERAWNGRTLRWTGMLALFVVLAGVTTYLAHLSEGEDEEENPTTTSQLS